MSDPGAVKSPTSRVVRYPWTDAFPDVVIHCGESAVKKHLRYAGGKSGNMDAAIALIKDTLSHEAIAQLERLCKDRHPVLISAHAQEREGVNIIPQTLAQVLQLKLGWPIEQSVVQQNVVNHTGADGFSRMARQASFSGTPEAVDFVLVDDFIGQGGTLANLRGYLIDQGARVLCATVLTGKAHSARVQQSADDLEKLRGKHGQLERWWIERFGFGFDCLTASETRYLINTEPTQRIRERIEAVSAV